MDKQLNLGKPALAAVESTEDKSSSGHKFGQLIGDWFEEYFVFPLLTKVAKELQLFLDVRFLKRPIRGSKILWKDGNGNFVDYDCVLELGGDANTIGIPVAFIESFWRRGARHSKDKARDDSGKLLPMWSTYPTARFLGIVAAGDFTSPARELVLSTGIDLFFIPKEKIIDAFTAHKLVIDYPDKAPEEEKARLVSDFDKQFTTEKKQAVAATLIDLVGAAAVGSYTDRVRARLSALPQEIRLILRHDSTPLVFSSVSEVTDFLKTPKFSMDQPTESYLYQATYSDGTEFELEVESIEAIKELHEQIRLLADHVTKLRQPTVE